MTKNRFTYHEKNGTPISHNWSDISDWKILTEDSTAYLIIEVFGNKETIAINWLDKSPKQIEILIIELK